MSLRDLFVEAPDSAAIAAELNAADASVCIHLRNPCFLRCGVRAASERLPDTSCVIGVDGLGVEIVETTMHVRRTGPWGVISPSHRRAWLERVAPRASATPPHDATRPTGEGP